MATLLANEATIQMRHHGPELDAKDAIGTANYRKSHRNLSIGR